MEEVEEICDNVTIMRRGSVAFHGTLAELRTVAPEPGHLLSTSDDPRAMSIATQHPDVTVARDPDAALVVAGSRPAVSAYVADLVAQHLDLYALTPTQTPLEALFCMLTDHPGQETAPVVSHELGGVR
jgi:ABC-2 type transport system ATP-binding protein